MTVDSNQTKPSDYEVIGGAPAVRWAVDVFYRLVLDDEQLAPYFAGVDLARLKQHQALLLAQVLGGPAQYTGRDLATAHAELRISDPHFDRVARHLSDALEQAGAGADVIGRVLTAVGGLRPQIVGRA